MQIAFHHVLFAQDASVPEWLHLVPAGTFRGVDGRGPYRLTNAQAVIHASMADGKLPLDENHAIDLAAPKGEPSPARAWIVAMEARDDGIHGRVEWTGPGQQLMSDRAYKGISPAFLHSRDGVVSRVLRASLTNTPNLTQLATLHHQQETTGMDLAAVRKALGLPEAADEAAILAAITANAQAIATHGQQLARIAQAAGLDAATAPDALVTALQTQQRAGDADLAGKVVALQTELATLQQATARRNAEAFVDGAIRAHKPIVSLRDHYVARHMANAADTEKEINALPSINAGGMDVSLNARGEPDGDEATPSEKAVAAKMGIDPKHMVTARKKRMANEGSAA